jgi:hypothetical protein
MFFLGLFLNDRRARHVSRIEDNSIMARHPLVKAHFALRSFFSLDKARWDLEPDAALAKLSLDPRTVRCHRLPRGIRYRCIKLFGPNFNTLIHPQVFKWKYYRLLSRVLAGLACRCAERLHLEMFIKASRPQVFLKIVELHAYGMWGGGIL